ncbi:GntR family transcriptional regulator [Streptomyces gamaensis]|uniref:GntR family transcriptional regulator n=1 Tax=Streptomyces gamaensis TaxID=1763542 RepID=A0ABW0YTU1_9ACTN
MAKYERIADTLRQCIRAGLFKPGDRLPTETALAKEHRASLPTVRDALAQLAEEGLIDKRHGIGNFVRESCRRIERTNERHQREKDQVREADTEHVATRSPEHDTGATASDGAFSSAYEEAEADEDLAVAFGVPLGTRLLKRIYRSCPQDEDEPFDLTESYLLHDLAAANPDLLDASHEPWPGGTQHQLHTIGIELDRIVERVTARPPTAREAEQLGLQKGVSLLVVRKTSIDVNGRVVEVAHTRLPGHRIELAFTTHLARRCDDQHLTESHRSAYARSTGNRYSMRQ